MTALPFSEQLAELIEGYEDDVIFHSRQSEYAMGVFKQLEAELTMLMPTVTAQEKQENAEQLERLKELRRQAHKLLFIEGDLPSNY